MELELLGSGLSLDLIRWDANGKPPELQNGADWSDSCSTGPSYTDSHLNIARGVATKRAALQ